MEEDGSPGSAKMRTTSSRFPYSPLRQSLPRCASATAIGGMIPLALAHSGLYSPLAVVLIGGMISSTLLSRIATPVLYLLIMRGSRAIAADDAGRREITGPSNALS